jgi:hypothetical protein
MASSFDDRLEELESRHAVRNEHLAVLEERIFTLERKAAGGKASPHSVRNASIGSTAIARSDGK